MDEKKKECDIRISASLFSLNGGLVLAVCIMITGIVIASIWTDRLAASQSVLFAILGVACWLYFTDSVTEKLTFAGNKIIKTSAIGRSERIDMDDVNNILLRHIGPNPELGIESVIVLYKDGTEDQMGLGPCWRKQEIESFLDSIESAMGYMAEVQYAV